MNTQISNDKPSTSKQCKKRARDKPNKRWSDEEIKGILQYLRHNQEFEKPTAKMYYTKLLESVCIDATWDIIKWKVRHLKANYYKTEEWRKNTGSGLHDSDEGVFSIEEKLRKMCKFYDDLHDAFGQKKVDFPFNVYESSSPNNMLSSTTVSNIQDDIGFEVLDDCIEVEEIEYDESNAEIIVEPHLLLPSQPVANDDFLLNKDNVKNFAKKLKRSAPKSAIEKLSALQIEKTEYLRSKMEFEKEKFAKELDLNERKFSEDVQKRKDEMEIKKLEIEKDERLKKLQIETNERIQKYEIDLKYAHNK